MMDLISYATLPLLLLAWPSNKI